MTVVTSKKQFVKLMDRVWDVISSSRKRYKEKAEDNSLTKQLKSVLLQHVDKKSSTSQIPFGSASETRNLALSTQTKYRYILKSLLNHNMAQDVKNKYNDMFENEKPFSEDTVESRLFVIANYKGDLKELKKDHDTRTVVRILQSKLREDLEDNPNTFARLSEFNMQAALYYILDFKPLYPRQDAYWLSDENFKKKFDEDENKLYYIQKDIAKSVLSGKGVDIESMSDEEIMSEASLITDMASMNMREKGYKEAAGLILFRGGKWVVVSGDIDSDGEPQELFYSEVVVHKKDIVKNRLLMAVVLGNTAAVKKYMQEIKKIDNVRDDVYGYTPLLNAIYRGWLDVVTILLTVSDVTVKSVNKKNYLQILEDGRENVENNQGTRKPWKKIEELILEHRSNKLKTTKGFVLKDMLHSKTGIQKDALEKDRKALEEAVLRTNSDLAFNYDGKRMQQEKTKKDDSTSSEPSSEPSSRPSSKPSSGPSSGPSSEPSSGPSSRPASEPSNGPASTASEPSSGPSSGPASEQFSNLFPFTSFIARNFLSTETPVASEDMPVPSGIPQDRRPPSPLVLGDTSPV